mgnify:CR=1 FL=1
MRLITPSELAKNDKLPKLPHQNDYILNLYNDNYSIETVYNYNRDLTFFALFLQDTSTDFYKIDKFTITYYKGWLKQRKHYEKIQELRGVETEKFRPDPKVNTNTVSEKSEGTFNSQYLSTDNNGNSSKSNNSFKGGYAKNNNPDELDANSINRILTSLRGFLRFLIEFDLESPLAPDAVTLIRKPKKKPQVPTLEEIIKLVEAPSKLEPKKIVALRNRALLETLLATGMRISEVVKLRRDQLNSEGKLFITGKGRKQRFAYLTARAMEHIKNYLNERRDSYSALFVPINGRSLTRDNPRISTNYLQMKIAEYRRLLEIVIPISAHSIRHAFATYIAENGGNPAAIQVLLGHESLQTTTKYVHTSDDFAEETHRKYHPAK